MSDYDHDSVQGSQASQMNDEERQRKQDAELAVKMSNVIDPALDRMKPLLKLITEVCSFVHFSTHHNPSSSVFETILIASGEMTYSAAETRPCQTRSRKRGTRRRSARQGRQTAHRIRLQRPPRDTRRYQSPRPGRKGLAAVEQAGGGPSGHARRAASRRVTCDVDWGGDRDDRECEECYPGYAPCEEQSRAIARCSYPYVISRLNPSSKCG